MTAAYRKFGLGNLVLLLALAWAGPGMALERLRLSLVGAAPEIGAQLEPALKATSTLFSARRDGRTDPQDLISAALADYAGLVEVLYGAGHYGGTVSIRIDGQEAARIPPLSPPPRIEQVEITIDPGPRFRFGEVGIAPRAPGSALPEDARRGKPARAAALRGAIRQAVGDWRATGHAKTRIAAQQVTADHPSARLSARIRLAPGPRLRFGRLVVTPGSAVRAERIRAIAGLPEGTVFTPDAVETAAKRLRSTGAFRSVVLREADAPRADDRLDITATVVDEKPRRIGAGAELSSLEGLRLSSYWVHRNLMGGAERLRLEGAIGGIGGESGGADIELGVRLDKPAILGPDTGLFLHADAEDLHEPEYTTREVSLGGGITRRFSDTLSGELGLDVSYSEVNDALGRRNFTLVSLPGTLLWDRRDDTLSPKAGTYLSLAAEPFVRVSGGSGAGARLVADARAYRAFGARDRTVLAGRLQLGTVVGPALDDTPPRMQFYSGGGGTVRGQPYQSLGVPQAGGGQTGGRSFAGVSAELRLGLSGKIGVVGFADAGYIGADGSFAGSGDWHAGAGLGLRYDTPVGPLRLDLAAPVEGRTGDGMQIYIGIGQAF
jgi:translocation and assembly module TamA